MFLDLALQNYIQKICNCTNFTVNATLLSCIDNNRALYTIQLSSPKVDSILQLWSDYEINNPEGIDVGVATISLYNYTNLSPTMLGESPKSSTSDTTAAIYFVVITSLLCLCVL